MIIIGRSPGKVFGALNFPAVYFSGAGFRLLQREQVGHAVVGARPRSELPPTPRPCGTARPSVRVVEQCGGVVGMSGVHVSHGTRKASLRRPRSYGAQLCCSAPRLSHGGVFPPGTILLEGGRMLGNLQFMPECQNPVKCLQTRARNGCCLPGRKL